MKLRILSKERPTSLKPIPDGELNWETKQSGAIENSLLFSGEALLSFAQDWESFLFRSSQRKEKALEEIQKKSLVLKQILWGAHPLPWDGLSFVEPIELITDSEYTIIPWEILPFGNGFLGDKPQVYRVLKGVVNPPGKQLPTHNFLILQNPVLPELQESTERECQEIEGMYFRFRSSGFRFLSHIRLSKLWEELLQAKYVHYSGHTEEKGIPLPKENLFLLETIGEKSLHHIEILFLNSCNSAVDAQGFSSLVRQFLLAGVQFVLGFLIPIPTKLAEIAGVQFWNAVFQGSDPEEAKELTKKALRKEGGLGILASLSLVSFSQGKQPKIPGLIRSLVPFLGLSLLMVFLVGVFVSFFSKKEAYTEILENPERAFQEFWETEEPLAFISTSLYESNVSLPSGEREFQEDFYYYSEKCKNQEIQWELHVLQIWEPELASKMLKACLEGKKVTVAELQKEISIRSNPTTLIIPLSYSRLVELKSENLRLTESWKKFIVLGANLYPGPHSSPMSRIFSLRNKIQEGLDRDIPDSRKKESLLAFQREILDSAKDLYFLNAFSPSNPWKETSLQEENQKTKEYFRAVLQEMNSDPIFPNPQRELVLELLQCLQKQNFEVNSLEKPKRLLFWMGFFVDYDFQKNLKMDSKAVNVSFLNHTKTLTYNSPLFQKRLLHIHSQCQKF